MKKIFAVFCALVLALALSASAESNSGIWQLTYYVDEFKLPTDEAYITNLEPITGTFCNSAVDDAQLNVSLLIDEYGISFVLYEYGDNKVKNSYSSQCAYDVTMLDGAKQKTYFTGWMEAAGGDRISFKAKDSENIIEALLKNAALSFYIAEQENPTTNYLFTIADTTGFADVLKELTASINEVDYQSAVNLFNSGRYTEALDIFATLIGYKDSIEWLPKYQAMLEGEADALMAEGNYEAANEKLCQLYKDTGIKGRLGEPWYVLGEERLAEADYDGAISAFELAEEYDYSDSKTRIKESQYSKAEAKLAAGEYAAANDAFIAAKDYSDAAQRVGEPWYVQGEKLVAEMNYEAAITAFENAGTYGDAAARVKVCWYTVAETKLSAKEYTAANAAFIAAGDYSDAVNRIGEPYYVQAETLMAAEDYEGANTAFKNAGSYNDAAQRVGEPCYVYAEILLSEGNKAEALMQYIKAGDFKNALQKKDSLWNEIAVRDTFAASQNGDIAILKDGSVAAKGDFSKASQWSDIIAVACGNFHAIGLKKDGTVMAVGENKLHQIEVEEWRDIVAISAYGNQSLGLKSDGTVVSTGGNINGDGRTPCNVKNWENVVAIAAGTRNAFGLRSDGTVYCADYEGNSYIIEDAEDIIAISAGVYDFVGLKSDGSLITTLGTFSFDVPLLDVVVGSYISVLTSEKEINFYASAWDQGKILDIGAKLKYDDIVSMYASPSSLFAITQKGEVVNINKDKVIQDNIKIPNRYDFCTLPENEDGYIYYSALQKGSKGDDVQNLQQALIDQGYLTGKADGDFGNMTADAVRAAQKSFGMEETGIADAAFQMKLFGK